MMTAATPADADPAGAASRELQGLAAVVNLLARVGGIDDLLGTRLSPPRDNRLHIGYTEAAERLNIPEKWLRERISKLPHRKFGKFVQFAEDDLRAISEMHFVKPGIPVTDDGDSPGLSPLQPSKRHRSRS